MFTMNLQLEHSTFPGLQSATGSFRACLPKSRLPSCKQAVSSALRPTVNHNAILQERGRSTVCNVAVQPVAAVDTTALSRYIFQSAAGIKVEALVEKAADTYIVTIIVDAGEESGPFSICWGTFRADSRKWFSPPEIVPAGSSQDPETGGSSTPLSERGGTLRTELRLPAKLAPVTLAFLVRSKDGPQATHFRPRDRRHFAIPVGMGPGSPSPLGATLVGVSQDGAQMCVNFAVRSRHADAMSLLLARHNPAAPGERLGKALEIALDPAVQRTGEVWHVAVEGLRNLETLCYAWRADGDSLWQGPSRFSPGRVMLDPYARAVTSTLLPEGFHVAASKGGNGAAPANPPALLGSLAPLLDEGPDFSASQRPNRALEDIVVLEVDVRTFTAGSPEATRGVPPEHQGKFLGVIDRVQALSTLGIGAVLLTPIVVSGPGDGPMGLAPYSFFAADPALAVGTDPLAASRELCMLAQALHNARIELWLQVEYCFTAEGGDVKSEAVSLRGLDAGVYYRSGLLLNCGHAAVRALVMDSLRYWATAAQVDGFVFVNAETLVQDRDGLVLDHPPLPEDIAGDPLLQPLKLVAMAGTDELLPRNGERGFPHSGLWLERNRRFTRDILQLLAEGRHGKASAIATRLLGSPDLFAARWDGGLPGGLACGRRPAFGLNGVVVVGGETLTELCDRMLPGDPSPELFFQRTTLAKTLLLICMLAQGTPILPQTVVWDDTMSKYINRLAHVRTAYVDLLLPPIFDSGREVRWHGDRAGTEPDWDESRASSEDSWGADYIAYSASILDDGEERSIYMGFNPHPGLVQLSLPSPPEGTVWGRVIDTALAPPEDVNVGGDSGSEPLVELPGGDYGIGAKAALVLTSVRKFSVPKATPPPAEGPAAPAPAA